MWEAEPHHSVCHPVSLNSCSCLLTVILICTQRGAGLQAVFILPPQSQAHGRLHTSYFSSANPRTFAFDFQIVLMSSCFLPPPSLPFSTAAPKPRSAELLRVPEKETSRQQNHITQAEVQTPDWTFKNTGPKPCVKRYWDHVGEAMLVLLCFCETGTQLSETRPTSLNSEFKIINWWTWHERGPPRTIKSNPPLKLCKIYTSPGLHRNKYLHLICYYPWLKVVHLLSSLTPNELLRAQFLSIGQSDKTCDWSTHFLVTGEALHHFFFFWSFFFLCISTKNLMVSVTERQAYFWLELNASKTDLEMYMGDLYTYSEK